jgi:hypothetical protein
LATAYVQGAFESTPGNEVNTPTLSTKTIYVPVQTGTPDLGAQFLDRNDELRGVDEPIAYATDVYEPVWSMSTRAYPDPLGFFLKNALGAPTTTAGNGLITDPDSVVIPTGATRHVWTAPFGPAGNNPQTSQYQFSYKDQSVAYKLKGAGVDTFELQSPDSGGCTVAVSGPALYLQRIAEPGLSPTYESLTTSPFLGTFFTNPTWLGSSGTANDVAVKATFPLRKEHTLAVSSQYPDQLFKDNPPIVWSGTITLVNLTAADFDAMLNATGFAVKLKWNSKIVIGATTYNYQMWFQALNCQYTGGGPEAIGNKRIHGATFDWTCTYAGTPGSVTWTLVNNVTSYA